MAGGATTLATTIVRGALSQVPLNSVTKKVVVALIEVVYVAAVLDCNDVPPVAVAYHRKIGDGAPDVEVTDAVGAPVPHCEEAADAVGAAGPGATVTTTELFVLLQRVLGFVAVTV